MAAGDVTILTADRTSLLARCRAIKLEGGKFPDPVQKSMEIADMLREVINAVEIT